MILFAIIIRENNKNRWDYLLSTMISWHRRKEECCWHYIGENGYSKLQGTSITRFAKSFLFWFLKVCGTQVALESQMYVANKIIGLQCTLSWGLYLFVNTYKDLQPQKIWKLLYTITPFLIVFLHGTCSRVYSSYPLNDGFHVLKKIRRNALQAWNFKLGLQFLVHFLL